MSSSRNSAATRSHTPRSHQRLSRCHRLAARPGVTQIVKLHGDFEDDGSIVFAESSHFDRLALDGPLDLKLRAGLLGRVALFVGYSVSDTSIRYLLYRLHRLWAGSAYGQARPRAFVYLGRPNPVQARVLTSWGIVPLFADGGDVGEGLRKLLERLAREAGLAEGNGETAQPVRPRRGGRRNDSGDRRKR